MPQTRMVVESDRVVVGRTPSGAMIGGLAQVKTAQEKRLGMVRPESEAVHVAAVGGRAVEILHGCRGAWVIQVPLQPSVERLDHGRSAVVQEPVGTCRTWRRGAGNRPGRSPSGCGRTKGAKWGPAGRRSAGSLVLAASGSRGSGGTRWPLCWSSGRFPAPGSRRTACRDWWDPS